ncbi:MAG: asparagine synthase (glutamine-hydrolyzing) [Legionellaceae bacterium]|nr:asparagine synthase (glutamine-hydrolyzing) [Legionellaceae bacterium]
MCGIVGSYNFDIPIDAFLASQMHRGPDFVASEAYTLPNGQVLQLGHNRLKIICLSDEANQPFKNATRLGYLVFNGEIYNYRELKVELEHAGVLFRTTSDTEVLFHVLSHWGMDGIQRCNGMFAFAYFNAQDNTLILGRDRFGVKPLFYYLDNQRLIFSSTTAPVANYCNLSPDFMYLKQGLQYGVYEDESSRTAYKNLHAVPAGHVLQFNLLATDLKPKIINYYDLKARVSSASAMIQGLTDKQLDDEVRALLYDANRLRLRADVPVAVAMSGGLDSSGIAAISKQQQVDIEAFCFGSLQDKQSEGLLAQQVASMHDIKLHFVAPQADAWGDAFWQTLHHQDAPFPSLSVIAQHVLYNKIKDAGFKVILGGQGGDEAFLGYRKYQFFYLKALLKAHDWTSAASFGLGLGQMLWAEKRQMATFLKNSVRYTQASGRTVGLNLPGDMASLQVGASGDVRGRQIADILQFSLPTLLRYEDRNSMAHSIETRLPFMDYRLIELACALPIRQKLKNGYGKWMLRKMLEKQVPEKICKARYKRGFDVTKNQAIRKTLGLELRDHVQKATPVLEAFMTEKPYDYFSPTQLEKSEHRFAELTTALWLAQKL